MCNCGDPSINLGNNRSGDIKRNNPKETSQILNKWVLDNLDRKLLIQEPIYDGYRGIIGYVTKNEAGNIVRIFSHNVKIILD
jgi:hypothetical protein